MKHVVFLIILGALILSCGSQQERNMRTASTNTESDTLRIANDSLEYEILIIEPGFNAWLTTQRPRGFYSETFLENRNRMYVIEYNQRVFQPQRFSPNLYEMRINYDSHIRYGYEVNYLLYNYFLFFEQRFRQRFTHSRRRAF